MSMIPLFPSLRPSVSSSICFDVDQPCDDESELREMEKDYDAWLKAVQETASDLQPFGENPPVGAPEQDTDDEANNDDSEDSESHDEEEEDDLEAMETNQTANVNIATATDTTSSYSAPEF